MILQVERGGCHARRGQNETRDAAEMHGAGSEHASLRDARRSRSLWAVRAAQEVTRVVHQVAPDLHQDERHERGDFIRRVSAQDFPQKLFKGASFNESERERERELI